MQKIDMSTTCVALFFKIVTTKTPEYLYSRITSRKNIHDRNTRSKPLIDVPKHNKEIYKSSFTYTGCRIGLRDIGFYM
jgi:hypothetical protein